MKFKINDLVVSINTKQDLNENNPQLCDQTFVCDPTHVQKPETPWGYHCDNTNRFPTIPTGYTRRCPGIIRANFPDNPHTPWGYHCDNTKRFPTVPTGYTRRCPTRHEIPDRCGLTRVYTPYAITQDIGNLNIEGLAALREQLNDAMELVKVREDQIKSSLSPGSIEEIEELETKLKGALEELSRKKQDIVKK